MSAWLAPTLRLSPNFRRRYNQTFLSLTTIYILIPSLMVVASLLAPARSNRVANIIISLLYLATIAGNLVGETWIYYILGSVVELALLLTIVRVAWNWRGRPVQQSAPTDLVGTVGEVGSRNPNLEHAQATVHGRLTST
jgi:hypothetical protein